ncbi:MAG: alpha/beta hydrolase-fold protein [Candidatus Marinimicrobia bacterium]|nr:alpha/beta hydrolase-fold protein [Candidatus Neomarinimicrobiota bacterium]
MNGECLIKVHLPENYHETDQAYPVLYMTDADWFYGTASDMAYMMGLEGKDFILVGIGYGDKATCRDKRLKDLGSDLNADSIPAYTLYQSFLKDELFPEIESRYRAASTNRTYFGWSLGALFANHLLYEQRDLFDNYILGGGRFPKSWSEHMQNSVRQARNDRPLSVYVGFPGRDATRESYINMLKSLKNEDLADIFLHWDIYPDQGHDIESVADVIYKGMKYTFSKKQLTPALMDRVERDGLDEALQHYEKWKVLRPEITDFSPHNLLDFSKYLNADQQQKFKIYFDKKYPPKTITFHLNSKTVPVENAVHITGNQQSLGFWNPSAVAMRQSPDGHWKSTISVMQETHLEYKFTLGSWETEALDANGQAVPNFKLTVEKDSVVTIMIPRWKSIDN